TAHECVCRKIDRFYLLLYSFLLNPPPTAVIYALSLHDALPICLARAGRRGDERVLAGGDVGPAPALRDGRPVREAAAEPGVDGGDRKSTRLNSSHVAISYAVFCLKKKKTANNHQVAALNQHLCY